MYNLKLLLRALRQHRTCQSGWCNGVLRRASNYRRPQPHAVVHNQFEELRRNYLADRTELTAAEWQETREALLKNYKYINTSNIDAVVLSVCGEGHQLLLAKDYVRFLRAQGTQPNLASLGRLLRIYNAVYHSRAAAGQTLSTAEQEEILEIYTVLRQRHELLDATSCENLIHGLVATDHWLDGKELLEMMRITATPSLSAYTEMALKAFSTHSLEYGWQLLEQMVSDRKQPKCDVYIAYLKAIAAAGGQQDFSKDFERLLLFVEQHELLLTEKVVDFIAELSERAPRRLTVARTRLNRLGKCGNCGNFMQIVSTSEAEFAKLSDSFLNKVLIRQDVFQKSTPEEVARFKQYVARTSPYDCVIDGLNVAYSTGVKKQPQAFANLLATVVKHFHVRNKHVLVLGRKHMNSWPRDAMQYIRKHASVFLTNNLTHDDPFLLYATIKSGPMTDFFSRDLMRTHAYLLGPELRTIFRRWQQEHQYSLVTQTDNGKIIVKEPIRHMIHAHSVQNTWHLPYVQEYSVNPNETYEVPENWLCVKIQKH